MRDLLSAVTGLFLIAASPGASAIDDLAWMSGRWESVSGERWVEENWSSPRGGAMFAVSRTGSGAALREFEFIRVQAGQDGRLVYHASPNGRSSVAFPLAEATATSATFLNPDHDFPQRIHYQRDGDILRATISAADGSNAMSWTFRRMP